MHDEDSAMPSAPGRQAREEAIAFLRWVGDRMATHEADLSRLMGWSAATPDAGWDGLRGAYRQLHSQARFWTDSSNSLATPPLRDRRLSPLRDQQTAAILDGWALAASIFIKTRTGSGFTADELAEFRSALRIR